MKATSTGSEDAVQKSARHLKWLWASLVLVVLIRVPVAVSADDAAQAADLNVWVADAPAELVIRQLAEMSGRKLVIDGELSGKVSGRFKGSVHDALSAIAEQTPVLFDISDVTLSATDDKNKIRSSIVAGDNPLDEATRNGLVANLTPGNDIEFRDNEIIVSGHPIFVRRTAMTVTAAFADSEHFRLNGIAASEVEVGSAETSAESADKGADKGAFDTTTFLDDTQKDKEAGLSLGVLQAQNSNNLTEENSNGVENVPALSDAGSQELVKDMRDTVEAGEQVVAVSSRSIDDESQRIVSDVPVDPDSADDIAGSALMSSEKEASGAVAEDAATPTSSANAQGQTDDEFQQSTRQPKEYKWVTDIPVSTHFNYRTLTGCSHCT